MTDLRYQDSSPYFVRSLYKGEDENTRLRTENAFAQWGFVENDHFTSFRVLLRFYDPAYVTTPADFSYRMKHSDL